MALAAGSESREPEKMRSIYSAGLVDLKKEALSLSKLINNFQLAKISRSANVVAHFIAKFSFDNRSDESRAIARYILRKYRTPGSPDLLGENGGANGATMVDVWTEVEAQQYHPAISPVVFECIIFPVMRGAATDQKFVDESLERLRGVLGTYEERLSESRYLAGDSFSFADLNHFPFTFYFMATPYAALFDEYPRVKAWWEDLMARPSVKRVCANMPTKF
ncbi:hypothetical protein CFC21_067875 [Triticum aestivum]|uniref:glutathione transferase n=2 Tax=Triticum aestivum TaxID=4565 RepID=A0A3B6KND7_WHEAT|nr:hypothetical protein CFC21_067875 [Triticum aestivum]